MNESQIHKCSIHGDTEHMWNDKRWRCRKCNQEAVTRHRKKKKLWCIDTLGGKCVICGYNGCIAAMEFHHRVPSEKKFSIGTSLGKSYTSLTAELKKCDLLCSNCHREIHFEWEMLGINDYHTGKNHEQRARTKTK